MQNNCVLLVVTLVALQASCVFAWSSSPALVTRASPSSSIATPPRALLPSSPRRVSRTIFPKASLADYGVESRVPENPAAVKCACGSGLKYEDCCYKFHKDEIVPKDPVDTIRARYSAYAYAIPNFIMKTTHPKSDEHKDNKQAWEQELVDFCQSYRFFRRGDRVLGVKIEDTRYLGNGDEASVQFRARMIGPGQKLVTFWERSRMVKEGDNWLYKSGNLLEFEGPLL